MLNVAPYSNSGRSLTRKSYMSDTKQDTPGFMTGSDAAERPRTAILLITDRKGYFLARYAIASILVSQTYAFDLYLFCTGWDGPDSGDTIRALAQRTGHRLIFPRLGTDQVAGSSVRTSKAGKLNAALSLSADYDRVLYTDTDILFFANLALEDVDFHGRSLAAVTDFSPENELTDYFNSGLMLFNTNMLDAEEIIDRFDEELVKHQASCSFRHGCSLIDQCPLNVAFFDDWILLPASWNMQASALFTADWENALARHYTGKLKFLPNLGRRADRRERAYLDTLASHLSDKRPTSRLSAWLYYLNGIRRLPMRKRMVKAIRLAEETRKESFRLRPQP